MNEENEHAENMSEKLAPPARFVGARYFLRRLRKRVLPFAAIGFVFICLALIQHWFVHAKVYSTISQELASWAADVAEPIAYRNKWDLTGYRNASPPVPSWFVVSEDGLIIDIVPNYSAFQKGEMRFEEIHHSLKSPACSGV